LHRVVAESLPDTSVFLFDQDLRILVAEGAAVRRLPWVDEGMFRGRTVGELQGELPSDVLAMSMGAYRGALNGERRTFDFKSAGLSYEVTAVPVRGEDGRVEAALAVVRDITERLKSEADRARLAAIDAGAALEDAERDAREREARLQALLDYAPVPVRLRAVDGRYLVINRACAELLGITTEEALEQVPPAPYVADYLDEQERQVLAGEGASTIEVSGLDSEGSSHEYLATKFPVIDGEGRLVAVGGIWLEITERKRALEALRESEERFRLLAENSRDLIRLYDAERKISYASPSSRTVLGYTPEELIGRHSTEFQHPDDIATLDGPRQAVLSGEDEITVTYRSRRKGGGYVWLEASVRALRDENTGAAIGYQEAARDITERKIFEQTLHETNLQLASANRAKDVFLSSMSHELRTPLNSILGFTGTLLMGLHGALTEDQATHLQIIQRSGKHLLSVINDLLDLARIESGKIELHPEPIDCQDILEEIAMGLLPLAQEKGLALEVRSSQRPVVLSSDRRTLTQILINLANNAIKFTDEGSVRLEVSQSVEGDRTVTSIAIVDTGRGIAAGDQARLFTAFEQISASETDVREGTGLGLHISQTLAQLIDGHITIHSTPGEGSTFTLTIAPATGGG